MPLVHLAILLTVATLVQIASSISCQAGIVQEHFCSPAMDTLFSLRRSLGSCDKCRLLTLLASFKSIGSPGDSIQVNVQIRSSLPDRFINCWSWLCFPPELRAVGENTLWDARFADVMGRVHRVVAVADTPGIYRVDLYCFAVENSGEIVPCRTQYWLKIQEGGVSWRAAARHGEEYSVPMDTSTTWITEADVAGSPSGMYLSPEECPKVLRAVQPEYPELARRAEIEGLVLVNVMIDEEGKVDSAQVYYSDNALLNPAALDAAFQFEFSPARPKGTPTRAAIVIPFRFILTD